MSEHKDSKAEVLYFKPASIGRTAGARCGACWKFVRPDGCLEVKGEIKAAGVCGLYMNGAPHDKASDHTWRILQVSKEEAGYTDDGDSHCGSCEYMKNPRSSYSPCEKVQGMVEPEGCCNEYEAR